MTKDDPTTTDNLVVIHLNLGRKTACGLDRTRGMLLTGDKEQVTCSQCDK